MKRTLLPVFLLMMASAAAFGDNSTMPDGTEFPMWEKPLHFTQTYYVDGQAKNADDNGPGTKDHPFRTINHAAQVLQPGERVVIADRRLSRGDPAGPRRNGAGRHDQLRGGARRECDGERRRRW